VDALRNACWYSAALGIVAMALGNSNLAVPRLLILVVSGLVLLNMYGWLHSIDPTERTQLLFSLFNSVGLFTLALPPPAGPVINVGADVSDMSLYPPTNLGSLGVKTLGIILFVVAGLGPIFVTRPA
jgi:hypothetical protein